MFRLVEPSAALAALPLLQPADTAGLGDADLVVVALGYEERATSGLMTLVEAGLAAGQVVVCEYPTDGDANNANREVIEALAEGLSASPISYLVDLESVSESLSLAISKLPRTRPVHVVFDLSSMSGRLVLACINALTFGEPRPDLRITFLYSEAEEYLPTQSQFESVNANADHATTLGLDEGVVTVDSAFTTRGSHIPELKDLLLIFPGFSRDRVRAAISSVNPALLLDPEDSVRWTVGTPRLQKDSWRQNAMMGIHKIDKASDLEYLSTFEYRSVYSYLESIYQEEWVRSNLSIVFLGSKLQGLAVGLFCAVRGGVRVIISTPERYETQQYTRGTREVWAATFEDWFAHLDALSSIGTVQLVD